MIVNGWRRKYKTTNKKRPPEKQKSSFALSEIGYPSYSHFLSSKEWNLICKQIIADQPICLLCSNTSEFVHHLDHEAETLFGKEKRTSAALCFHCYDAITFDSRGTGRKRTLKGANAVFRSMASRCQSGIAFLTDLESIAVSRKQNGKKLGPAIDHVKRQIAKMEDKFRQSGEFEITNEFLEAGMSDGGGWNKQQMLLLRVWPPRKGWKKRVVGRYLSNAEAQQFLSLRNK